MKDIAIYGAGGFGKEIACLLNWINSDCEQWNLVGYFDDGKIKGTTVSHYGEVLGGIKELNEWKEPVNIIVAIADIRARTKVLQLINNAFVSFPNIIAPDFIVKDTSTFVLGQGNIIQGKCVASCDVKIGNFNVFNGSIVIGHDSIIGNNNVIMPGVRISGAVHVGNDNFFGVASIVLQQINVKNNVRLAAGSVLMTPPKDGCLYIGVPAKIMKF